MDSFTTLTAATAVFLIYAGERFKVGAYLLNAIIFVILFAWRMGEEIFYLGSAALIVVLIYRAFTGEDDIRDSQSVNDGE